MSTPTPAARTGTDDLWEAIATQRAIRRYRPDPVPRDLLWRVLEAATRAPSGSNRQPWAFLVVEDAARRQRIAEGVAAYLQSNEWLRNYFEQGSQSNERSKRLMLGGALELARNIGRAPVLIVPCLFPARGDGLLDGSSIFPAVQNLLLAARGVGLGAVLTTFQQGILPLLRTEFGIAEAAKPVALIPMGIPDANFGPTKRKPVATVVHWETWGNQE